MQKLLAPTASEVTELLKAATDGGYVVMLLPASDWLASQHRADRALTIPPLRGGAESLAVTFGLLFKLTPSESRLLVELVEHDPASRTELHRALSQNDNPVTGIKIVDVTISQLRRKLALYGIEIATVHGGYRLTEGARDKLRGLLAEFGENVVAATTPPRPKASEPDLQAPQERA